MSARMFALLVVFAVLATVVVVAMPDATGSSTLAPVDFQRVFVGAHMSGLSGRESVKDPVAITSSGDDGTFWLDLVVDVVETIPGAVSFSRQADGSLALETISAPEWMVGKIRDYIADDYKGLEDAVLSQSLVVASGFIDWLGSQEENTAAPPEEQKPPYLGATLSLQGRLVTVNMRGWDLLLEAREKDSGWKLEVIACKRTATP